MPKIVDHDKKREEIALKAATIFLEFGYKDLGMRQLCTHLNMSKSAVYHYFKSKDALFRASTEAMVKFDELVLANNPLANTANLDEKVNNFIQIFNILAPRHFQEMKLVMEYIDVIGQEQVAQDSNMILANDKYQSLLASYVDDTQPEVLYTLLLGLLTQQVVSGKSASRESISSLVEKHLAL